MSQSLPVYYFDFGQTISSPRGMATRRAVLPDQPESSIRRFEYRFEDMDFIASLAMLVPRVDNLGMLPAELADGLDVSAAIALADRCAPRSVHGSEGWYREIHVRIPIRQDRLIEAADARLALEGFLNWLTDDRWRIEFVKRMREPRPSENHRLLFSLASRAPLVVLHSGGLDSFTGIVEASKNLQKNPVIAVSVATHSRTEAVQQSIISGLRSCLSTEIVRTKIGIGLTGRDLDDRESSQRARSFLYLMSGAVAAALCGARQLQLSENGIGAFNLPYSKQQIGARNTHAMHPHTLDLFSRLTDVLIDRHIDVRNTAVWKTKAERCQEFLQDQQIIEAAKLTTSCDRFPWRGQDRPCGRCISCLYRRLSLCAANLHDIDKKSYRSELKSVYDFDVTSRDAKWSEHDLIPLYALKSQAERLRRSLNTLDPFRALAKEFLALSKVFESESYLRLSEQETRDRIIRMYRQYVSEWDAFGKTVAWPPSVCELPITDEAVAS